MQVYVGNFYAESDVEPFAVDGLIADLTRACGETKIKFHSRRLWLGMVLPMVLSRKQRFKLRGELLAELNRLSPASRFTTADFQRVGSKKQLLIKAGRA